jgi:phosphopantetheinyl transferase
MEINNVYKKYIDENSVLAITKIDKNEHKLRNICNLSDIDLFLLEHSSSTQRRLEILNVRFLLKEIGISENITYKNRKPIIENGFISISHSDKYAGIIYSRNSQYSIDIEELDGRILRISKRAFNDKELDISKNDITVLNHFWNAKECVYKLAGTKGIEFKTQILLEEFNNTKSAIFSLNTISNKTYFKIYFDSFDNHTLAYAKILEEL